MPVPDRHLHRQFEAKNTGFCHRGNMCDSFLRQTKNRWISDEISVLKGSVVTFFSHLPSLPQDQFYRHMLDSSPHL